MTPTPLPAECAAGLDVVPPEDTPWGNRGVVMIDPTATSFASAHRSEMSTGNCFH
jgi:hypothetical protein